MCNEKYFSYIVSEVQYGGRVTDDYDKRLLNTFSKIWLTDVIFQEKFEFYDGYPMIILNQISDYIEKIALMPNSDPPQVYGLHANADIT